MTAAANPQPACARDDYATAEEILHEALARLKHEREGQAGYLVECREQLAYAEEMHRQAVVAEAAVEQLLNSQSFNFNDRALAQIAELEAEPEVSAEIGQLVAGPALAPSTPVETVNWRLARSPGEPIASALADLASAVVVEARETAEAAPEPATQSEPHISAPVSEIEPEPPAQPEPIIEPILQPATAAEAPAVRKSPSFEARRGGKAAAFQREDEDRLLSAIAKLSGASGEVQVSLTGLAEASGIPTGSMTFVVRRAVDAGQLEVMKNFRPGSRTPAPSTYRLVGVQPCKTAPKYSDPIPVAAPSLPAVLKAPERPKESVLWEKAEPVTRTRPARALAATDCPAVPAAAPSPAQPLVVPVEFDDADMPAWWPAGSLLALKSGDCKWPTNTPPPGRGEETKFCCKPAIEGASYCPAHVDAAHGRAVRA